MSDSEMSVVMKASEYTLSRPIRNSIKIGELFMPNQYDDFMDCRRSLNVPKSQDDFNIRYDSLIEAR